MRLLVEERGSTGWQMRQRQYVTVRQGRVETGTRQEESKSAEECSLTILLLLLIFSSSVGGKVWLYLLARSVFAFSEDVVKSSLDTSYGLLKK